MNMNLHNYHLNEMNLNNWYTFLSVRACIDDYMQQHLYCKFNKDNSNMEKVMDKNPFLHVKLFSNTLLTLRA